MSMESDASLAPDERQADMPVSSGFSLSTLAHLGAAYGAIAAVLWYIQSNASGN